jgi:hypothetical protein
MMQSIDLYDELCDPLYEEKVFLLTPDASASAVFHQYGCVGCLHLEVKAQVAELEGEPARLAHEAAYCRNNDWNELPLNDAALNLGELLGSPAIEMYEGLITLKDGRIVTIYNCD